MSAVSIRAALETALAAVTPSITTQLENDPEAIPTDGTPYQSAVVLYAKPDNREISRSYVALGFMQVTLCYPKGKGTGAIEAQVEVLKAAFYRGRSLTPVGGVTVTITDTPETLAPYIDGNRYCIPLRAPFMAPVTA